MDVNFLLAPLALGANHLAITTRLAAFGAAGTSMAMTE
jgi:hypothetical protein